MLDLGSAEWDAVGAVALIGGAQKDADLPEGFQAVFDRDQLNVLRFGAGEQGPERAGDQVDLLLFDAVAGHLQGHLGNEMKSTFVGEKNFHTSLPGRIAEAMKEPLPQ